MLATAINRLTRFTLLLALIIIQLPTSTTEAAQDDFLKDIKTSEEPVVIKGDRVEYLHDQNKAVGEGNISITYGDVELTCDKIIVYTDTKEAICEGNVTITQLGATMTGDKINYNFSTKKGYVLGGNVRAKPWYGGAERVEQVQDDEFMLQQGYITTCDLEKPHYRIQAKELQIFLDKKVVAKHILVFIGNVPIFYLPIYVQPLIEKRPHVTIIPGRTGDWGYYALTSWRYYFDENSKGDLHLDYREKKGLAEGIDYRYNIEEWGSGIARFYYAHENDGLTLSKSGDKDDRWRIHNRHTIELPSDSVCTFEFNKLSDRDIIKDLMYREFEENPVPDNYILFTNTKSNYILNLLVRKRMDTFFTVVERLPELKLESHNQRLWDSNFYYFSTNSVTNFIKRYDEVRNRSAEKTFRADTYQKLSYASKILRFLYVTPFTATRQTFYSKNRWKDESKLRTIYEGGVDLSTKFYKVFDVTSNFMGLDINRLRHIVTPSAGYIHRHQPTISPLNLYQFDSIDSIDYANQFNLVLENKLQTKRSGGDSSKVVDLATFIVSTDYLFRLKKKSLEPQGVGRFTDLRFDLELRPYSWLSIDSDMTIDYKDYDINSANLDLYADLGDKFTLGIGHRYDTRADTTHLITGEMSYKLNDKWKVKVYERYDISSQKLEEQEYIIFRDLHCWIGEFAFSIRNEEYMFYVVFKLKAFPEIPIGLFRTSYRRTRPGGRY